MIILLITKHDNVLLQCTTARSITNYGNVLLQFAIGTLLQFTTTVITIYDRYYNSRQLLLQFTTDITIHDVITIYDSTCVVCAKMKINVLGVNYAIFRASIDVAM